MIHSVRSRSGDPMVASYQMAGRREVVPYEISDAVEMWARQWGRHGKIVFQPMLACYVIELTLRDDDPRMKAYREGHETHEPKECIPLHYQPRDHNGRASVHFVGINIHELGVSGVLEILNKGNTWSGTGEYRSTQEYAAAVARRNDDLKHQIKRAAMENSRDRAKDMRRQILDLPLVSVPDNIGDSNA